MTNKPKTTVGQELRARRIGLEYSLHKVEVATKIRGRYLRAIEADDYPQLPNDVYSRGFVRQYANFLGLQGAELAKRYQAERGNPAQPSQQVKPRAIALRLGATSRWAASLVALGAVAIVVGYLLWQFSSLTAAPSLQLNSPTKDSVVVGASIDVNGSTAPGSDVFLNDVPLPSDVNGNFKTKLILQPGINEVRVVSKNKLGKQTVIIRNILSKQLTTDELPKVAFDGVAVLLVATDTASVKIVADGKTVYEGSIAKGSTKLASAKNSIVIESGKPGSIRAKLTNAVVAAYDFGLLGDKETARTVEFTRTTQIAQ